MTLRQGDLEMKFLGHQVKVLVIGIGQMHKLLSQDLAKQDRAGHGIYGHRYQVSVGLAMEVGDKTTSENADSKNRNQLVKVL